MIVIGRYPIYLQEADRLKGRVFNVSQEEWAAMSPDQRWAINKEFLDAAIVADEQIIPATPPEKVPLGSTLEKELNYLASHDCFPNQIGDHWELYGPKQFEGFIWIRNSKIRQIFSANLDSLPSL
jgi:hypothetical protein